MSDQVPRGWQQGADGQPAAFRPLAGEPNPFAELPRGAAPGSYKVEYRLDGFTSEQELAARVLERLEPWFVIGREVVGRHCSGARLRIDAMLRPRDASSWRDPDVAFGVEFKAPRRDANLGTYTGWIAQAVDYTHVDWDGFGRRIILTCPGVNALLGAFQGTRDGDGDLLVAKRLMGQLGVGELVLRWAYGLTILVNGERIWSERDGLGAGRRWSMNLRAGSR
ncbi:hypothetical protein [Nonomuraea sp. NPDC050691]|uniref:hypothetical protein n=1 Tax=Nonomuraea sp. NPDC050691 TaxID=3155661 RepID=UPI0033F57112